MGTKQTKDVSIQFRTTAEIKELAQRLAERERRSLASLLELLILREAETMGLKKDER